MGYRKKNRTNGYLVLGVAIIVLLALGFFVQDFSIDTSVKSGDFISIPTYGYLKCEKSQNEISIPPAPSDFNKFQDATITCQGYTGNTLIQDCDVTIKSPSKDVITGSHTAILWSVCTIGSECNIQNPQETKWLKGQYVPYVYNDANINQQWKVPLKSTEYLRVLYNEGNILTFEIKSANKGLIKMYYEPYQIYRYDIFSASNGQAVTNTLDCANGNALSERNFLIENIRGGGALSSQLQKSELLDLNNLRSRDKSTSYMSNFVKIVPQYNMFSDNTRYCVDKKIYAVEEVVTPSGTYKIADVGVNRVVQSVQCCNSGDVPSGYYCDNFQIKPLSQSEGVSCSITPDCPIVGYQALAGGKVAYQTCVSGQCKTSYIEGITCNFNEECSGGYCQVDQSNPRNNKCVFASAQSYCGNGVCEFSRGETVQSCPKDCSVPRTSGVDATVLLIIGGFVVFILLLFVVRSRMNGNNSGGIGF